MSKRVIYSVLITFILIASLFTVFAAPNFDLNGDGSVTVADISSLAQLYRGKGVYNASYDFNNDSEINLFDIVRLARNISTSVGLNPFSDPSPDIIFLHHSTGGNIWNGGLPTWINNYNSGNNESYNISDQAFPKSSPYGWVNYPYDYWNIWVNHAGSEYYLEEPTLEILTPDYEVIIFKHCYPVGLILEDTGNPDISSSTKSIENYKLQYEALKTKMLEFPDTRFIIWTGAALTEASTTPAQANRTRFFFEWVKNTWDEEGDNIFVWDFYELETEGGNYLLEGYAMSSTDSHPNSAFSNTVAPYLGQRIVDVIEGRGDTGNLTGIV